MTKKQTFSFTQPKAAIDPELRIDEINNSKCVNPQMFNIGVLQTKTGIEVPALLPLLSLKGLCFLTDTSNQEFAHHFLQLLAFRVIASLPTGLCKVTLIDTSGGENFKFFNSLSKKINENSKILTQKEEITNAFKRLIETRDNNIQKIKGYKNNSFLEYNVSAGIEASQPYNFILISNIQTLKSSNFETLQGIIENGHVSGIYTLFTTTTLFENEKNKENLKIHPLLPIILQVRKSYYIKNFEHQNFFGVQNIFVPNATIPTNVENILNTINDNVDNYIRQPINLIPYLFEKGAWVRTAIEGIEIPIGKINISEIQHFVLDKGTGNYHALIGGKTGYGKTILLHNIIYNTASLYSPNEVQFIILDYKEGLSFEIYRQLPHIKILAVDAKRQFGLSVLQYLVDEMNRRALLFKEIDVTIEKYEQYRKKSSKSIPRLICIIDEFQELLSNAYTQGRKSTLLLDILTAKGRAYGIHVILSSQSLGRTNVELQTATLTNIKVRIVLALTADAIKDFLAPTNTAPLSLTQQGDAIYNAGNGFSEHNTQFRVAKLDAELIKENNLIEYQNKVASMKGFEVTDRYIFDNKDVIFSDNPHLKENELNNTWQINNRFLKIYVGEYLSYNSEHTCYKIGQDKGWNVCIVGQDRIALLSIMYWSLYQIIKQSSEDSQFYVFDLLNVDDDQKGCLNVLQNNFKNVTIKERESECLAILDDICTELKTRKGQEKSGYRIVISIVNFDKMQQATLTKLITILQDGSEYGICVLLHSFTYNSLLNKIKRTGIKDYFTTRIALKGGDAESILEADLKREPVQENTAYISTEDLEDSLSFRVYKANFTNENN